MRIRNTGNEKLAALESFELIIIYYGGLYRNRGIEPETGDEKDDVHKLWLYTGHARQFGASVPLPATNRTLR
jgi:hypothetical protein